MQLGLGATRAVVTMTMGAALLAVTPGTADASLPAALSTTRVSVADDESEGNGLSFDPSISGDGRFVTFSSDAPNLVPGDSNGQRDVFVRDLVEGTTELVSVNSNGVQADASSGESRISDDGRFVAFYSYAKNLVPGLSSEFGSHIFVRDLVNGTTELVSVSTAGVPANSSSSDIDISEDGRFVAFMSYATNLDGSDTNFQTDVFLRDRQAGTTVRVSDATDGTQANQPSFAPSVSSDGHVAWQSFGNNLVTGDTNQRTDVFLHDPQTSVTTRASLAQGGGQSSSSGEAPDLSADGKHLAYMSQGNSDYSIYVRDLVSGNVEQISVSSGEVPGNGGSFYPSLNRDGSQVMFFSRASNFLEGDTNDFDLFLRDRTAGSTERVDVAAHGGDVNNLGYSVGFDISADGEHFAFDGVALRAVDLSYVDDDTNNAVDVFVVAPAGPDSTGPMITPEVTPGSPDGSAGWYKGTPTLRWRLLDAESNVTSRTGCESVTIDADTGAEGTTYTCTAASSGGTTQQSVTIRRDGTAPTITGSVSPTVPDGANGWYVTAPEVSFACSDALSGVATCESGPVELTEGATAQNVTRQALDVAGNQGIASATGLKVDLTAPQVACDTRGPFLLGETGQVTATVTDAISGPEQASVAANANTSRVGAGTVTITGHDLAGRSAAVDCDYDVIYDFTGFVGRAEAPTLNRVSAGTSAPLKFRLDGFHGKRVVKAVGSVKTACSSTAMVDPTATHATTTAYVTATETYKYAWATKAAWRGTCRVFTMTLKDGTQHQARFKFTR